MPTIATSVKCLNTVFNTPQRIQGAISVPRHYRSAPIILKSFAANGTLSTCADEISIRFDNIQNPNDYSNDAKTLNFFLKQYALTSQHFFPDFLIGMLLPGNIEVQFEIQVSSKNRTNFTLPSDIYFVMLIDDIDM